MWNTQSHYFRMQMHELCRGYIVVYSLTDDESTIKFRQVLTRSPVENNRRIIKAHSLGSLRLPARQPVTQDESPSAPRPDRSLSRVALSRPYTLHGVYRHPQKRCALNSEVSCVMGVR